MKGWIFAAAAMMVFCAGMAAAKVDNKAVEKQKPAESSFPAAVVSAQQAVDEKQLLANNFAALQNQQARVMVLQQLLNREAANMRQMEAVFCDQYKLDPEKWRKGLYRYDEKAGKFLEQAPVAMGKSER